MLMFLVQQQLQQELPQCDCTLHTWGGREGRVRASTRQVWGAGGGGAGEPSVPPLPSPGAQYPRVMSSPPGHSESGASGCILETATIQKYRAALGSSCSQHLPTGDRIALELKRKMMHERPTCSLRPQTILHLTLVSVSTHPINSFAGRSLVRSWLWMPDPLIRASAWGPGIMRLGDISRGDYRLSCARKGLRGLTLSSQHSDNPAHSARRQHAPAGRCLPP